MLKHHLVLTIRRLRKNLGWTCIHLGGLTIGIVCVFLIGLLVRYELSFDQFHNQADQIYRLTTDIIRKQDGHVFSGAMARESLALKLPEAFPEFEEVVKIRANGGKTTVYREESQQYLESGLYFASPNFFTFFSFPLLLGDPNTALQDKDTVVISQKMAEKFFGDEDPIGKTLFLGKPYTITGVAANPPANTHLQFSMVAPLWTIPFETSYYMYFRLAKGTDAALLESKFPNWAEKNNYTGPKKRFNSVFHLQPITDIHFGGSQESDISPPSDVREVYLLVGLALLILVTACINYINLSTARFATRAKEVGVRKAAGASRGVLIQQFLGEAVVLCLLAFLCATVLVELLIPVFGKVSGLPENTLVMDWAFVGILMIGVVLVVGGLAGSYPALFLSAFQAVDVLRGHLSVSGFEKHLRRGLVIFQMGAVCVLLICTVVVYRQLDFVKTFNPGFDVAQVLSFKATIPEVAKSVFLQHPDILKITGSKGVPGVRGNSFDFMPEGFGKERVRFRLLQVDYDFFDTYGIKLVSGRRFSSDFSTDQKDAFILNEAAAKKLGWDDPVGKSFVIRQGQVRSDNARVIGVVKNFQFDSLHNPIEPLVIGLNWKLGFPSDSYVHTLAVKIRTDAVHKVLPFIRDNVAELQPNRPFEYQFLDEMFDAFYQREERLMRILGTFALVAGLIPCLGLLGLAAFAVEQRTKEIGIRKVLGASSWQITQLIGRSFLYWTLVANVIAWPIAYWLANMWLKDFAYRTVISWDIFALVGGVTTLLVLVTVGLRTLYSAQINPVEALRRS